MVWIWRISLLADSWDCFIFGQFVYLICMSSINLVLLLSLVLKLTTLYMCSILFCSALSIEFRVITSSNWISFRVFLFVYQCVWMCSCVSERVSPWVSVYFSFALQRTSTVIFSFIIIFNSNLQSSFSRGFLFLRHFPSLSGSIEATYRQNIR